MKILVALHEIMDLGGIINHTEQLIGGLRELGHTVHLKEITYREPEKAWDKKLSGDFLVGPSGIPHDQGKGWNFRRQDRIGYRTGRGVLFAKKELEQYDIVIWTVPVPSKNKGNLGNHEWLELYDLDPRVRQVAFVHDGNAGRGYPHILSVQEKLAGVACVHHCALNSSAFLTVPRALVLNPQEDPVREIRPWEKKHSGFVNMQTFKAWKHVHELIEAIAYMPSITPNELREVAGRGIEYQYLTSEDKCKENYFHGASDKWFSGFKFWDAALGNDMNYHGYWNTEEVDGMLQQARVLVDPSWSTRYSADGGHYNRVVVDAMIRGAVPVARRLGMGTELFLPGEHYIEIPQTAGPQEYADIILEAGNMSQDKANHFRDAASDVLPFFDRVTVAQRLVDLAMGNLETVGKSADDFNRKNQSDDILFNHFGILA